jgi:hypothetical protein
MTKFSNAPVKHFLRDINTLIVAGLIVVIPIGFLVPHVGFGVTVYDIIVTIIRGVVASLSFSTAPFTGK